MTQSCSRGSCCWTLVLLVLAHFGFDEKQRHGTLQPASAHMRPSRRAPRSFDRAAEPRYRTHQRVRRQHHFTQLERDPRKGVTLALLYWVISNTGEIDPFYKSHQFSRALVCAVQAGRRDVVKLLSAWCPTGLAVDDMEAYAKHGNLQCLEWLAWNHRNVIWFPQLMHTAVKHGQVEVMRFLHEFTASPYFEDFEATEDDEREFEDLVETVKATKRDEAAARDVLGIANVRMPEVDHTEDYTTATMDGAARDGYLEVLKWLHRHQREGALKPRWTKRQREASSVLSSSWMRIAQKAALSGR